MAGIRGHLPTVNEMRTSMRQMLSSAAGQHQLDTFPADRPMFAPGHLLRTDGLPVDQTLAGLRRRAEKLAPGSDEAVQNHALHERIVSVSDLTPALYEALAASDSSIMNWFPALAQAVNAASSDDSGDTGLDLSLPATSIWRMPIELAQFARLPYEQTNAVSRELFNEITADRLGLRPDGEYFIKTGGFSSKFEFANARCAEPAEAGEYFQVITNSAMSLGAATTVDLCAREYVEPDPGTPTIYHGMPLRTELRAFIDLGPQALGPHEPEPAGHGVLGVTPYWHPSVMKRALALAEDRPGMDHIAGDYRTYCEHEPVLRAGFERWREPVAQTLQTLVPHLRAAGLSGAWSVDFMVTGERLWLIDMALMACSALSEQLLVTDEYATAGPTVTRPLARELVYTVPRRRGTGRTPGLGDADGAGFQVIGPPDAGIAYRYRWHQAPLPSAHN